MERNRKKKIVFTNRRITKRIGLTLSTDINFESMRSDIEMSVDIPDGVNRAEASDALYNDLISDLKEDSARLKCDIVKCRWGNV